MTTLSDTLKTRASAAYAGAINIADGAIGGYAITKSDSAVLSPPFRALYVGSTGNVVIRGADGNNVTFTSVPAGAILPVRGDQVLSTSTTASGFVGLY